MRFNLVALDETEYWADEITAKSGRIWGVYMYNPNKKTHCCEMTPSYYLIPVEFFTEKHVDDETWEDMHNNGWPLAYTDAVYVHCHSVDAIPKRKDGVRLKYSGTGFENEDEALEYYQGNSMLG